MRGSPWPGVSYPHPPTPLRTNTRARFAILGGGLSGLATALHLARAVPADDIVLLEAFEVGHGATARSTGMLGPGVGGPITTLVERHGDATAVRMWRATESAVESAIDLVRAEGLACDLAVAPQLKVARTALQAESLARQARAFARLGIDVPFVGPADLRPLIATRYAGGLVFEHAALVNPRRLCEELRRVLVARGVRIHEQSPVTKLDRRDGVRVSLRSGHELRAEHVVVATNAFAPELGVLRRQVVPLHTHAILTARLTPVARALLGGPRPLAVVESGRFFSYFRTTPDGRLMLGGGAPVPASATRGPSQRRSVTTFRELEGELARFHPSLLGIDIEARWSGPLGFTLDELPVVGPLDGGVSFTGAWCGHGLALSLASGERIARVALDQAEDDAPLPWMRARAPALPIEPLASAGLAVYLGALDLADRWGRARAEVPS